MSYVLGVDLGTTYSAAAIAERGRVEIVQLGTRQATVPSVVVLRADGEVLVGEAAERRALSEPGRVAREFKRRLGDPTPLILGGTPYGAEALTARLLASIVATVTGLKGEPPQLVAVTHPASYGPYKLDLLQQAARQADVHLVTFVSEPVAAAIHYSQEERIEPGAVVAVYDFGGGTFDAALLRRTADGFELLGEGEGLERLGGIDFDEAVFAHTANALDGALASLPADAQGSGAAVARLREECTRAKETLSEDTEATIPVLLPNVQTEVRLTRAEFEAIIRPRIRETISALERAVRRAGLAMDDVDRVLLVGGTSRIPLVAEMVREFTGRPVAIDAQPKHAIALGAAALAARESDAGDAMVPPPAAVAVQTAEPVEPDAGATGALPQASPEPGPSQAVPPAVPRGQSRDPAPAVPAPAHAPVPTDATPPTIVGPAVSPSVRAAGGSPATQGAPVLAAGAQSPAPNAPAAAVSPPARPPKAPGRPRDGGGWVPLRTVLVVAVPVLVLAAAIAAFLVLSGGGDGDGEVASADATETAEASQTAAAAEDETETPASTPTATRTPTPAPTPTPTRPPQDSQVNNITLSGNRYVVDFSTFGFEPLIGGQFHIHFFFDTVPPTQAGLPATGPWFVYDVPNPFTGYTTADRPAGAGQMCILVARTDHSVIQDTGNCFDLP